MEKAPSATVVIPAYRADLSGDEVISLEACRKYLGNWGLCFVVPRSLPQPSWMHSTDRIVRFPDAYFTYPYGYNHLLMSRCFYSAFRQYDYILLHQLDCLVFRDELASWCSKGFDYVGAPWFDDYRSVGKKRWTVGNGGFSLRKVSAALRVLSRPMARGSLYPLPMPGHPQPAGLTWLLVNILRRLRQHLGLWKVEHELANCDANEDRFWSFVAPGLCPGFRLPEPELALQFAFEMHPRECLEKNGGVMPFGCHAWTKIERDFWADIIQRNHSNHGCEKG